MRQCKCGGLVREHQLTQGRQAWTCGACGRYEVVGEKNDPRDGDEDFGQTEGGNALPSDNHQSGTDDDRGLG
jgi:hypothetical protein